MTIRKVLIYVAAWTAVLSSPQMTHSDESSPTMVVFGRDGFATPMYVTWDGSRWSSPQFTANGVGKEPYWVVLRDCPTRNELTCAIQNEDKQLWCTNYINGSWGNFMKINDDSGNAEQRVFDIAYERLSGDTLAVYYDDDESNIGYVTFNGTTLSSETDLAAPNNSKVEYVTLYPHPTTDEIILIVITSDGHLTARRWDGSSWGSWSTISTKVTSKSSEVYSFVYESQSKQGIVVYGDDNEREPQYRTWNGTSWSNAGNLPDVGAKSMWIQLAPDSATDEVLCGVLDADKDLNLVVWNGTAWGSAVEVETDIQENDRRQFNIAYEEGGNEAIVVYQQSGQNSFRYRTWNGSAWSGEANGQDLGGEKMMVVAGATGTTAGEVLFTMSDDDPDLELIRWTGSALEPKALIESNVAGTVKTQAFMISTPTSPVKSMIAHYQFDATTGQTVSDASGTNNDGTLGSSSSVESVDPSRVCGTNGGGVFFDGTDDYVAVASDSSLKVKRALSIAAWINGSSWSSGNDVNTIVRKGDDDPKNYALAVKGRRVNLFLNDDDSDTGHPGNTTLQANRWYHVVGTWDGTDVRIYVDGVVDNTLPDTFTSQLGTDNRNLYVGGRTGADRFHGGIDDVRIYNYALTPAEIATIMAETQGFTDVSNCEGFAIQTTSDAGYYASAAHWGDLDNDGDLDAIVTGNTAKLMINNGAAGFTSSSFGGGDIRRQCALGDLDNDGDLDFWISTTGNWDTERLYENNGTSSFSNAGNLGMSGPTNNEGIAVGDVDKDGWMDVIMFSGNAKNWIGHNDGVTPLALTETDDSSFGLNDSGDYGNGDFVSSGDVNGDGYLDFFYHYGTGKLFLSDGDGTYTEDRGNISVVTGNSDKMGSAWIDYDNDGDLDLYVSRYDSNQSVYLWQNTGGSFTNVASAAGISGTSRVRSGCWGDYDNDGDLDLYCVTHSGNDNILFQSNGNGTFTAVTAGVTANGNGHDCVFVDYDNDGDLDLSVTQEDTTNTLLRNGLNNQNYLKVRVLGGGNGNTPVSANGVRVDLLTADGNTLLARRDIAVARGFGGTEPMWLHFGGVNPATSYTLRVHWNDGAEDFAVVPQSASTTIGSTTIPQMITLQEAGGQLVMKQHGNKRAGDRKTRIRLMRDAPGFSRPVKNKNRMRQMRQNVGGVSPPPPAP